MRSGSNQIQNSFPLLLYHRAWAVTWNFCRFLVRYGSPFKMKTVNDSKKTVNITTVRSRCKIWTPYCIFDSFIEKEKTESFIIYTVIFFRNPFLKFWAFLQITNMFFLYWSSKKPMSFLKYFDFSEHSLFSEKYKKIFCDKV